MTQEKIDVKVFGLFFKENKVLVTVFEKSRTPEKIYKPPSGKIKFGETSADAVNRIVLEQFNSKIENLEFLTLIESHFKILEKQKHELQFIFQADFQNRELYEYNEVDIKSKDKTAYWISVHDFLQLKKVIVPKNVLPFFKQK